MTADDHTSFDPATTLDQINAATEHLMETAARFTDADVRAPSLLPAWSRGHVLTHLARNADGGRNLLVWARTGQETPEYPSLAARDEQIEAGAGRSTAELVADLRSAAARFATEYRRMPPEAWNRVVRWTRGQERAAVRAADSRLCEVLIHQRRPERRLHARPVANRLRPGHARPGSGVLHRSRRRSRDAAAHHRHRDQLRHRHRTTGADHPRPTDLTPGLVDGTRPRHRPCRQRSLGATHTTVPLLIDSLGAPNTSINSSTVLDHCSASASAPGLATAGSPEH
ncbi:maleylpyruvate isomerase family mycothiol-dependent enzyme [Streptomyces broussonetiae]|uniref:Maleylpyruvate isomerase family mycothiol-dependent enzyme n=1 Tax=Streptomyces broussonetiae TaxID=2686304 RepID=A0A6I6MTL9_9ACTN|nr:maleylpyruvate isomerase N-terminal domain-containing protein [Streptomyces broussonetiae]QHA02354.1 maleylpyruvate isomerase family mycothiol-dependent enzyme [Streptomyces broussonetiae]